MEIITTQFKYTDNTFDIVFERVATSYYTEYFINNNKVTRMEYITRYNKFISNNNYTYTVYKEKR